MAKPDPATYIKRSTSRRIRKFREQLDKAIRRGKRKARSGPSVKDRVADRVWQDLRDEIRDAD